MDSGDTCRIAPHDAERVLEFAAHRWPTSGFSSAEWPLTAGGVIRDASKRALLLHFAPGRWLAPGPTREVNDRLERAARNGAGALVDVTGKWARISITGPGAARLLASALDSHALLSGRECAAVTLFDCPAILARGEEGFESWLQASYVDDFLAIAGRIRATLRSARP